MILMVWMFHCILCYIWCLLCHFIMLQKALRPHKLIFRSAILGKVSLLSNLYMSNHKELDNHSLRLIALERNGSHTIETRRNAYLQLNYKLFSSLFYLHVVLYYHYSDNCHYKQWNSHSL